ncbi:hypothetical protein IP69_04330 [Bosea sp. AAP35]|uniref:bifunctional DNA primase/polymerase n=1 Tax=Bosea sp. AAP35 TaxID=1523417 RepID=UPI0006B9B99B|nr:bifunctional DNA primase/polymerase [Bosea sp. AAP35]KPF72039.1 hypothetical protein IP69_04330 [Bosea sp. AAP35]
MSEDLAIEPLPIKSLRPANDADGPASLNHDPLVALLDDAASYDEERVRAHETSESRYQDAVASGKAPKRPAALRLLDWSRSTILSHEPARAEYLQQLRDRNGVARIIGDQVAPYYAWVRQQAERPLGSHLAAVTANGFNCLPVFGKMPAPPRDYIAPGAHFAFDDPARPAWTDACSRPWQQSILDYWTTNRAKASIGLACGPLQSGAAFGLIALDIDADDAATVAIWREELARELNLDPDALMQRGRAGSPRVLVPIRIAMSGIDRVPSAKMHGAELLGHGKQFAAFGYHVSGSAYEWTNGSPATVRHMDLPVIDVDQLAAVTFRAYGRLGRIADAEEMAQSIVLTAVNGVQEATASTLATAEVSGLVRSAHSSGMSIFSLANDMALRNLTHWIYGLAGVAEIKPRRNGFDAVPMFRDTGRSSKDRARDGRSLTFGPPGTTQAGIKDQVAGTKFSAIDLVMASEGFSKVRALRWLCERLCLVAEYDESRRVWFAGEKDIDLAAIREKARLVRDFNTMLAGVLVKPDDAPHVDDEPIVEDDALAVADAASEASTAAPVSIEQAREIASACVDSAFAHAAKPRTNETAVTRVLRARLGVGKTTAFITRVLTWLWSGEDTDGCVVYAAPTDALARETYDKLVATAPAGSVSRIGGRGTVIDGEPLCGRVEDVNRFARHMPGVSIIKTICTAPTENGGCPLAASCRYLAQAKASETKHRKPHLVIVSSQFLTSPGAVIPLHVALLVLDESIIGSMTTQVADIGVSTISALRATAEETRAKARSCRSVAGSGLMPKVEAFAAADDLAITLRQIEPNRIITAERLAEAGLDFAAVRHLAHWASMMSEACRPEHECGRVNLDTEHVYAARWHETAAMLTAIVEWEDSLHERVPVLIENELSERRVRVVARRRLPEHLRTVPVLAMDGTGEIELIELALRRTIAPENIVDAWPDDPAGVENLYVSDAPVGKAEMLDRKTGVAAGHNRIISALKRNLGDNALVVMPKAIREAKASKGQGFLDYRGLGIGHFNGLAGSNAFEHVRWISLHSREIPPAYDLVPMAIALKLDDLDDNSSRYSKTSRPIRLRNGSTLSMQIDSHGDPVVDALLRASTDGEQLQAAERGRAVNRSEDKPLTTVYATGRLHPRVVIDDAPRWGATAAGIADVVREASGGWMIYGRRGLLPALPVATELKETLTWYPANRGWPAMSQQGALARVEIKDGVLISLRELAPPVGAVLYRVTEANTGDWHIECPPGTTAENAQRFVRSLGALTAHVEGVAGSRALASWQEHGIATDSAAACVIIDPMTWGDKRNASRSPGGLLDPAALAAADPNVVLFRITRPASSSAFVVAIDSARYPHPVPHLEGLFSGRGKLAGKLPKVERVGAPQEPAKTPAGVLPFVRPATPSVPALGLAGGLLAGWHPAQPNDLAGPTAGWASRPWVAATFVGLM